MTDVDPLFELFSRLMAEPEFDLGTSLHWGEFVAVSAQMEHRGIPLNMDIVPDLLDKRAWAYVRDAVVPKINEQYDVNVQDKTGEWHFNNEKFDALCARLGIDWPRTETGKPDLRQKTLKSMCQAFPELVARESHAPHGHARGFGHPPKNFPPPPGVPKWSKTSKMGRNASKCLELASITAMGAHPARIAVVWGPGNASISGVLSLGAAELARLGCPSANGARERGRV